MIAIVTVCYIALIILIYKVVKIRPNPKNIAVMVVLGVVMIGTIIIVWKFSAPMSNHLVVARYTVALAPQVKGPITKIHAEPNTPLKSGKDLLFEIQRDTYQNTVDQLEAAAIGAEAAINKSQASRAAASVTLMLFFA